jgi:hypothetical protein
MLSPLETGTTLRVTSGTWEEPGDRPLARVPGTGGRPAASARPGNWSAWRGEARQGPSISYMEGPFLILPLLAGDQLLIPGGRGQHVNFQVSACSCSSAGLA